MNILIFSEYRSLLDTRPTFKCIEIAIVGKYAYNTLHFCFWPFYISVQCRCHWTKVPLKSKKVPLLHFSFMQKWIILFSAQCQPSLLENCILFSHPLSVVVTWRTLVVLGFYLILVSEGRTHTFFMVYMHSTTDSMELAPVPKMRFAFFPLIIHCNI